MTESCVRRLILITVLQQDFLTISTGKRKHDEISSGYYIPQRDGAADDELSTSMGETGGIVVSSPETLSFYENEKAGYGLWSLEDTMAPKLKCPRGV